MARKSFLSLEKCLTKMLAKGEYKKVKGVMGNLTVAKDFFTAVSVLHGQKKNRDTVVLYESLFRSFRMRNHIIDDYLTANEWHKWTEILIEMSSVLWRYRDIFEHKAWLETNAQIYKVAFRNFNYFEKKARNKICSQCSRLLQVILLNFAQYAREEDRAEDFSLLVDDLEEVLQMIGSSLNSLTYCDFIKEKISSHSQQ